MAAYIIRRLVWTVPVVLLVILMTFNPRTREART